MVKGRKKIYQANGPPKQAGVAILISNKVDFKPKLVRREKEYQCIQIKGTIHQEQKTIINFYASNISTPNFIKHTLKGLKSQIDI
jgi:hypothetical protein